jgi:U3 small nucleolar RNA-associated protein 4
VTGNLKPKRIRDFSSILQTHLPDSPISTGGSVFHFTPDSRKLAMATALSSYILFVDLGTNSEKPRVLRRFNHHRTRNLVGGDRIVKRTASEVKEERERRKKAFEMGQNGASNVDIIMADIDADEAGPAVTSVSRMAISADGQWLATMDDLARTYIFNLDSVQVHSFFIPMRHKYSLYYAVPLCSPLFSSTRPISNVQVVQS